MATACECALNSRLNTAQLHAQNVQQVLSHPLVIAAADKAEAAGIDIFTILETILPIIWQLFQGVSFASVITQVIAAIEALILNPPALKKLSRLSA